MHGAWKERQGLNIAGQRLCDQARMTKINRWLTTLEMNLIKKSVMNENVKKNIAKLLAVMTVVKKRQRKMNVRIY